MTRVGYTTFRIDKDRISDDLEKAETLLSALDREIESDRTSLRRLDTEEAALKSILSIAANRERLRTMETGVFRGFNAYVECETFDAAKLSETEKRLETLASSRTALDRNIRRVSEARSIVEDDIRALRALFEWHSFPFEMGVKVSVL